MRFPLALFIAVSLLAAVATDAGPACAPPTAGNTFILYTGPTSNCTAGSGSCAAAEPIAFNVGTFGYNLACTVHTFTWNFGDGGVGTGSNATHAYASPGTPFVVEYSKCSASPGCTSG